MTDWTDSAVPVSCQSAENPGQEAGRHTSLLPVYARGDALRAVVQRARRGSVHVGQQLVSEIGSGLVILLGVTHGDGTRESERLSEKIAHLRIFEDAGGKMNLSLLDVQGAALVVSQFTLYASARRGRRPDFVAAAPPETAEPLVTHFAEALRRQGVARVVTGAFGAHMLVEIHNDGPVTIVLDTAEL